MGTPFKTAEGRPRGLGGCQGGRNMKVFSTGLALVALGATLGSSTPYHHLRRQSLSDGYGAPQGPILTSGTGSSGGGGGGRPSNNGGGGNNGGRPSYNNNGGGGKKPFNPFALFGG